MFTLAKFILEEPANNGNLGRQEYSPLRFSSTHVRGNTYILYVFDMTTDQGRILEPAGSDIENWL